VRQIPNEANCIGQNQLGRGARNRISDVKLAGQGIERRKQLIGSVRACTCEGIEKRAFTCVGVADERNRKRPLPQSLTAASQALSFSAVDQDAQLSDFVVEHAPVEFDLLFTWPPTQTDSTLLSLKVCPASHETGCLVLHLSQFHLKLALMAAGTLGEDFEDQTNSLNDLDTPDLLQITLLYRRQRMIKQHMINLLCLKALTNLSHFSSANKRGWVRTSSMDRDSPTHCDPSRTGQSGKFVKGTLITSNAANPDAD
jgi:hypothetical protein